jgi:hypothetical protein
MRLLCLLAGLLARLLRLLLTLLIDLWHLCVFKFDDIYGTVAISNRGAYTSSLPSSWLGFLPWLEFLAESPSSLLRLDIVFGIFSNLDNRLQLMKGGPLK